MSIVASPTQQGVVQSPNAAHLRTNVINGKVRIASSTNNTGGQPAVYHIVGGSITNNIEVSLPDLTTDDRLATQGDNITWTGSHLFQNGLSSNGPIVTSSSISAGSLSANTLTSTSTISTAGDLQAGGNVIVPGQINPSSSGYVTSIGSNLTVGSNLTATNGTSSLQTLNVAATHTASGPIVANSTVTVGTSSGIGLTHNAGSMQVIPTGLGYSSNLLLRNDTGGTDAAFFGLTVGTTSGLVIGTTRPPGGNRVAFFNTAPSTQLTGGALTASASYDATTRGMINTMWSAMRTFGFLN